MQLRVDVLPEGYTINIFRLELSNRKQKVGQSFAEKFFDNDNARPHTNP